MKFNNKFSGIVMMLIGVFWFIIQDILTEIYPSDYSNIELSAITSIILITYYIVIYFYIPYWFVSKGFKELEGELKTK